MENIEKQIENINKEKEKNILELLKNEKVEWKKLGEVCEIKNGYTPSKNKREYWENGTIPWIRVEDIRLNNGEIYNSIQKITSSAIKKELFEKNSLIVSTTATIGLVAIVKVPFICNQQLTVLTPNKILNESYLYYYLNNNIDSLMKLANPSGGIKIINTTSLKTLQIPIPSLEVQEKIVKTLDKFTKYVSELQAELQARTKQYNYYRDMLLSENYLTKMTNKFIKEQVFKLSWEELSNVVKIRNGRDWKNLKKGNIPVYGSGGEMGIYVDKFSYNKPTVLIPRKGSIENVFYLDKPFWNVDTIFYTEIDENKIIPKYFYYFIQNFDIKSLSTDSTRPSVTQSALNKLMIPLPPREIQNKVVLVLDKFQKLLDETNGLLPEEIEQRRKQYNYYREKLLTFETKYDRTNERTNERTITLTLTL